MKPLPTGAREEMHTILNIFYRCKGGDMGMTIKCGVKELEDNTVDEKTLKTINNAKKTQNKKTRAGL